MTIQINEQSIETAKAYWLSAYAIDDGRVIGGCNVQGWKSECPVLSYLWVDPAHRRKGVGTAIVRACLDRARDVGKFSLVLVVEKENADAERLYRRIGFRVFSDDDKCRWLAVTLNQQEAAACG